MASIDPVRKAWLAQHAAGERELLRVVDGFFREQEKRIAKALKDFDEPTPSIVPLIFQPDDEHTKFITAISDPLAALMAQGAVDELDRKPTPKTEKGLFEVFQNFSLSQFIKDAIGAAFDELIGQDYWRQIQTTTSEVLTDVLKQGIEEGQSGSRLTRWLRNILGETQRVRAKAIARTETTAAYNSGHQSVMTTLAGDTTFEGKRWLAILDNDVRASHESLNGVVVPGDGNFNVGGSSAPYPGHPSLPASQRINCRCVIVSTFTDLP